MYGISFNDAGEVLLWTIFGVFIGAALGGYLDHWTRYAESPMRILYFWESGVSSGPGFIGGGLAGLYKLRRLGASANSFSDAAAVPCSFMLFIGRWGCFLNGCCQGIPTSSAWGVAFRSAPSVRVFPSQLFESFAGLLIGVILLAVQRKLRRSPEYVSRGGVLMPVFLVLYGIYRFIFDFLRAGDRILGLRIGQYTGALAFFIGVVWLVNSLKRTSSESSSEGAERLQS
jgi:phosphatidylglycerol:prolipoprotein diacylglycerol transferase